MRRGMASSLVARKSDSRRSVNCMERYRVSAHVQCFRLHDQRVLAGHPFFSELCVLEGSLADLFDSIRHRSLTTSEVSERLHIPIDSIRQGIDFLKAKRIVLSEGQDEDSEILDLVRKHQRLPDQAGAQEPISISRPFHEYSAVSLEALEAHIAIEHVRDVRFLIAGGCLTKASADALQRLAASYGIRASVRVSWLHTNDPDELERPDVLVFQPSTNWMLRPLWDEGPFLSDDERGERLNIMKEHLQVSLDRLRRRVRDGLLLVQTLSVPTMSPLGLAEFRLKYNFYRIVSELNDVLIDAVKTDPSAMIIDEERILSRVGKARLMDDCVSVFSHHGPLDLMLESAGSALEEISGPIQRCHTAHLFSRAYLDAYVAWSGIGRIKCIVVDLDNTLWSGIVGTPGFDIDEAIRELHAGPYAGIHQALRLLKQRGVLLASCSRNNEEASRLAWERIDRVAEELGWSYVLRHDDFVIHKVNWRRKSGNIADIAGALGLSTDAILFIDDNHVEREEVRTAFPGIRTLGSNLWRVRSELLSDPCLQSSVLTAESARRTSMTRAQIQRDMVRAEVPSENAFLRKLDVRLSIEHTRDCQSIGRITELIQRTNQFNTTLVRLSAAQVRSYMEDSRRAAYTLNVRDRFASYGLVGVCLICDDEITAFALSCRVIPLQAEVPFLCTVLTAHGRTPMTGTITEGPRNEPCRQLYVRAHFDLVAPGRYVLNQLSRLPQVDASIYTIDLQVQQQPAHLSRASI